MPPHETLEVAWSEWNGLDPAGMVAVATGEAALTLALRALELPPYSEILMPDYSMIATANAAHDAGHVPVFVDGGDDLLLSQEWYTACLMGSEWYPNRIAAVVPVHVYGRAVDTEELCYWVEERQGGCAVVEDLAEAHGIRPHPVSDAACWSFQASKVVHGSEGGAVWFREPGRAALARRLRNVGFAPGQDYRHAAGGRNCRLSDAHAALVLASLAEVEDNLARRRGLEAEYDRLCPAPWRLPPRASPWVYDLRLPGLTRGRMLELVHALNAAGVAARPGFFPLSGQEEYRHCRTVPAGCPNAYRAAEEVFTLPLAPERATPDTPARAFEVLRRACGA